MYLLYDNKVAGPFDYVHSNVIEYHAPGGHAVTDINNCLDTTCCIARIYVMSNMEEILENGGEFINTGKNTCLDNIV